MYETTTLGAPRPHKGCVQALCEVCSGEQGLWRVWRRKHGLRVGAKECTGLGGRLARPWRGCAMVALAGRGGRHRRPREMLLAGTWPDRSIGCAARTKTHRKTTTPRLLTAMACWDPVCARAVHMLDFSPAEVCRVEHAGDPPAAQGAGAQSLLRHACLPRAVCVDRHASAGGGRTCECGGTSGPRALCNAHGWPRNSR